MSVCAYKKVITFVQEHFTCLEWHKKSEDNICKNIKKISLHPCVILIKVKVLRDLDNKMSCRFNIE